MKQNKIKILFFILVFMQNIRANIPFCISLGSACGPALNLRNLNLRSEAYPFDWTVTPFDSLYNALREDFKYFLADLLIRPDNQGVIDHYGINYTHDWPTLHQPHIDALNADFISNCTLFSAWQNALPLVREKYQRRINRFRNACLSQNKIFFIRSEETDKEQAVKLKDLIVNIYPSLDFTLIIFGSDIKFQNPWNIDKIKNFYVPRWDDPVLWGQTLKQVGSEFALLRIMLINIQKNKLGNELICSECRKLLMKEKK